MIKKHHKLMWSFSKSFIQSLKRPIFIYLTSLSFTSMLVFSFLFYIFERDSNSSVSSMFDSLYYTVTVMTGVGLGDIFPKTNLGRGLSMIMMLSGTVLFVSFTGVLAASILNVEADHSEKIQ